MIICMIIVYVVGMVVSNLFIPFSFPFIIFIIFIYFVSVFYIYSNWLLLTINLMTSRGVKCSPASSFDCSAPIRISSSNT